MEDKLQEVQLEITMRLLPVIVLAAIFIVIGIAGNILVIVFYVKTNKRTSPSLLIKYLAVADLATCIASIPIIVEMAINVRYTQSVVCKVTHFLGNWTVGCSCFMLMVISVDRYRKICKPLGKQITVSSIKYVAVAAIVFPLLTALKNWAVFDTNNVYVTVLNSNETLKGYICSARNDGVYKHLSVAFYLLDFILVLIIWVTIIITYSMIIYTLLKRRFKMYRTSSEVKSSLRTKRTSSKCSVKSCESSSVPNFTSLEQCSNIQSNSSEHEDEGSKAEVFTITGTEQEKTESSRRQTKIRFEYSSVRKPSERNITLMMFTVSVFFLLCFTPYFVVRVLVGLVWSSGKEYNPNAGIEFALTLPYINSVFNSVLYCIFNVQFRNYIKSLVLKCPK